jgi:plasmid maintenance system killer protein
VPKHTILPPNRGVPGGDRNDEGQIKWSVLISSEIWDLLDSYDKSLQGIFIRAFRFLSRHMSQPSLRVELIKAGKDSFYRLRVDPQYRLHFELHKAGYYLILAIGSHRLQGIG